MSAQWVPGLGYAFMISEVALAVVRRSRASSSRSADRGSLVLLWMVIVISITFAYSFAYCAPRATMDPGVAPSLRIVGLVVFLAGLALRWYAIIYLGRFFTVNVAIASDHRVIDTGPYRYIRHPSLYRCIDGISGPRPLSCQLAVAGVCDTTHALRLPLADSGRGGGAARSFGREIPRIHARYATPDPRHLLRRNQDASIPAPLHRQCRRSSRW